MDQPRPTEEEVARDRYRELLEELRTVQPGVQVLFAFLLTAPFSSRFEQLDDLGRAGYMTALVLAGLAVTTFLAPTSFHRVAPRDDRHHRIRVAVRLAVAGMMAVLLSMTAALFVVARFIFGTTEGLLVAGVVLVAGALLWYLLPLRRRLSQ